MRSRSIAVTAAVAVAAVGAAAVTSGTASASTAKKAPSKHVLLLSVDGLHQSDLAYYVKAHPTSALAALVKGGTQYTHAQTTNPSDSFPGMVAQLTGGTPSATGIFYDDTFNNSLFPAGTINCATATRGAEVSFTEAADKSQNPITLDAGQGIDSAALKALPTNTLAQTLAAQKAITAAALKMTPTPQALLNPAALPVNPATCLPIYPHSYLRVNTVFDVAKSAGMVTAWSDKHPAYEILSGPTGTGIGDLFTPEINSVADAAGDDWTTDNALTQEYDSIKVAAIQNEINGMDHSGTRHVGVPAVFGMNFQTVSTAQKLPTSDGLTGGYLANGTPGPLVKRALDYINTQVGAMVARIRANHLQKSTTIILSAKHGQSPINPTTLRRVDDGAIIDAVNTAWHASHPSNPTLIRFSVDDDAMLMWLSDRSKAAETFVRHYLLTHSAPANRITDPKGTYSTTVSASGLTSVRVGRAADAYFGAKAGDSHVPDLVGVVQHGVVYTGGVKKISEHGGASADDRNVPLIVAGAGSIAHATIAGSVQTTQIAPTILRLLGLNPKSLQAVQKQHTKVLPGI